MLKTRNPFPLKPFYFIRHGETDWNRQNIVMGSIDIPLNELGLKQAHEASNLLEKTNFNVIISSPRIRAHQTAEIIAKKTKKPIILDHNIAERVQGEAEGKPVDSTKSIFDDNDTPRGAETFSIFQARVVEAIASILIKEPLPVFVSHAGVFKALTHYLGFQGLSSANCLPFHFNPSEKSSHHWEINPLYFEGNGT